MILVKEEVLDNCFYQLMGCVTFFSPVLFKIVLTV